MKTPRSLFPKLAIILLCAGRVSTVYAANSLHFLVVGDTGSGLEPQKRVAEAMAEHASQSAATNAVNFVLMLGDNFYENGVSTVDDPQWQSKFELMYDARRLPMPFFAVLGNHDWRNGHPDAQIDYARAHPGTRWQMDGHWFKREFPSESADTNAPPFADIFLIDTEALDATEAHVSQYPDKKLGEEEMAWLQEQLKESRARWKIVAAHHPLYSDGEHGHDKQVLDLRARLDPLFRQWKVDAFITGHDHDLQRLEVPGNPTLFLVSGAGSKTRPGFDGEWKPFHAAVNGFAAIKLTDTEMRGEFLDADGKVLDAWHRPPLSATGK